MTKAIQISKTSSMLLLLCTILFFTNFFTACKSDKKSSKEENKKIENTNSVEIDSIFNLSNSQCNTDNDPAPLYRLGKLVYTGTGSGYDIQPVSASSIGGGNIHVITHGWAPYYLTAVNDYKAQTGNTLLAWAPQAMETKNGKPTGQRYFVGKFLPLAIAVQNADPGSTVLCFSWIDHSATDSFDDPYVSEDCTIDMGHALNSALLQAFQPNQSRNIQFLGHSHGTKVVTVAGILAQRIPNANLLQLTLFDSPERAPANSIGGADNKLYEILHYFSPNRTNRFVENYISYYGECYNNISNRPALNPIIDIVFRPSYHGCWNGYEECISCAHEYGVVWYTNQTNAKSGFGMGWSPLTNPTSAPSLEKDYLQHKDSDGIVAVTGCQQDVIYWCSDPATEENKPEE